ncbi:MAG: response regulator [Elusimicrobia bacterium]|nr:response regulator [Elusimicrobiota bacterium]
MDRRLKILSSDDDEGIRAFLFSLLAEQGHEVEFARDSDEVFKNLGRSRYDLLILDVNTPGLNGYKVAEKITSNIVNRPKILIFTARDIEEENFQFVVSGADAVLRKGASCERILEEIERMFPTQPAPPDPAQPPAAPEEKKRKKINEDLEFCLSRLTQVEDGIAAKNMRYEEFIRDLLREKQRTERNYLEFKRIEAEVLRMKSWGYALATVAILALIKALF